LEAEGVDLELLGFSDAELATLLTEGEERDSGADEEAIAEAPVTAVTQPGDLWIVGPHRLLCGDCREAGSLVRVFEGRQAHVVITSPPYATQREYDPASGFKPVAPDEYVEWYRTVATNIHTLLAPDGSYLLNIKPDPHRLQYRHRAHRGRAL
jgi:hypothetical protein